jgi:HlyD family secretion protein
LKNASSQGQLWFRRGVKVALIAAIGLFVWFIWPKRIIEVRILEVARGSVEEIIGSLQAGEVKSERKAAIRAVTVGRVSGLYVERGDRVKDGQLLVELESSILKARLRLARANLEAGTSAHRAAVLRKEVSERSLKRSKTLAAKGVLSSQALDRVQAEFDVASEGVLTSEANLAQLKASVDLSMAALEESRIRAPFAGMVVRVHVEKGESLVVGSPVLDLVDDSIKTVVASVDEADAGRLKTGMPVRVECDSFPGRNFEGNLAWIAPVVLKDARQNRHLEVEVGLDGNASLLKVGMSADIEIVIQSAENVLFVPTNSIMRRGEVSQVYVLEGGFARLRSIKTGMTNWDRTQVLDGLREGDHVIVSLETRGLKDGVRVRASGTTSSQRVAY